MHTDDSVIKTIIKDEQVEIYRPLDLNDENNSNVKLLNRQLSKSNLIGDRDTGYKLTDAKLISNVNLTQQFSGVINELKSRTKVIHRIVGFYILQDDDETLINDIATNGCSTKKCKINYLGDSAIGVYLCKHLDVLLAYSNQKYEKLKLFMFKVVYSKFRIVNDENNELDNNFDCNFTSNIPQADQSLFEQYLNSMMFIYDYDSSTRECNKTPRTILPYALLTFERTKLLNEGQINGHHFDFFDIDNKLKLQQEANMNTLKIKSENGDEIDSSKDNISKSRLHYEHTGELNVKFRGTAKLKIKLNDLSRSNMKFLDEENTCISLSNSTNRLILAYIDKRKNVNKLTTSKSFNNPPAVSDVSSKRVSESLSNGSIVNAVKQEDAKNVNKLLLTKPPAAVDQVKFLNKKPFSQEQLQQQNTHLLKQQKEQRQPVGNLNSDSTSLEKHLLKNRKNLSTAITQNVNRISTTTTAVPQSKHHLDKLNHRLLLEMNNKRYEDKKREEALMRLLNGFWNDHEWRNSLVECPQVSARHYYDYQTSGMEFELRRLNVQRFESIKTAEKINSENISKIETYNPKVMHCGGFNGIEAGKCGTNLRIELTNEAIRRRNTTALLPTPNIKRLPECMSVKMRASTTEESILSINASFNANSNSNFESAAQQIKAEPVHIVNTTVTISSSQDTTPFTRRSSSSNLYSLVSQVKEEPGEIVDVKKEPQKRKLVPTSLTDELKKRIGNSIVRNSDNEYNNSINGNNSASSVANETESQQASEIKSLKRKHKSRSILTKKRANKCNDSSSQSPLSGTDNHVNIKKHKKSNKQKLKKSRASSVSSYSSQSSSSSSASSSASSSSSSSSMSLSSSSQSVSNSSSVNKLLKLEATNFTATPNSDTKISFNSTTSAHRLMNTPSTLNHKQDSLLQNDEAVDYDIYDCDLSMINNLVSSNSDPSVSIQQKKQFTPSNTTTKTVSSTKIATPPVLSTPRPSLPKPILQTPIRQQLRPRLPSSAPPNMNIARSHLPYPQVKNRNFPVYSINNTPRFNAPPTARFNPPPMAANYQQNDPFPYYHGPNNFNNNNKSFNMPPAEPVPYYDDFPKRQTSLEITHPNGFKHQAEPFKHHHSAPLSTMNTPLSEQKKPHNQINTSMKRIPPPSPVKIPPAPFRFNKINPNQSNITNKNNNTNSHQEPTKNKIS